MFESVFVNDGMLHALSVVIPLFVMALLVVITLNLFRNLLESILSIPFVKFGILAGILIITLKIWV